MSNESILDTLLKLSSAEATEVNHLSLALSKQLYTNQSLIGHIFVPTIRSSLVTKVELEELFESETIHIRASGYIDDDGLCKISVGVAFVQHFRDEPVEIVGIILNTIFDYVMRENLGYIVNDVVVNDVQVRNFYSSTSDD